MEHQSAKSKRPGLNEDAPMQQPMRERTKPAQRRAPSQDQKKQRRQMQRQANAEPDHRGRIWDVCANCGESGHDAAGIDPNVPWVHAASGNGRCDVSQPADAVMLQGVDTPEFEPMYAHSSKTAAEVTSERPVLSCLACGCRCNSAPCGMCGSVMVQAGKGNVLTRGPKTCSTCDGQGTVFRAADTTKCPDCDGVGVLDKTAAKTVCRGCHTSMVAPDDEDFPLCGKCQGDDEWKRIQQATSMRKGAPFAGYKDFDDCVAKNRDKDDPQAYCGSIKHKVEGTRHQADYLDDAASRDCQSCGHSAPPVLGDTGPACRRCGSYSLVRPGGQSGRALGTKGLTPFQARMQSVAAGTQMAPGSQTQTRTVAEDDDFDPYLITRCPNDGIKATGDRPSQEHYIELAQQCHNEAAHPDARRRREHWQGHLHEGLSCWSCCEEMQVAKPGERTSGRTARLLREAKDCRYCSGRGTSPMGTATCPKCEGDGQARPEPERQPQRGEQKPGWLDRFRQWANPSPEEMNRQTERYEQRRQQRQQRRQQRQQEWEEYQQTPEYQQRQQQEAWEQYQRQMQQRMQEQQRWYPMMSLPPMHHQHHPRHPQQQSAQPQGRPTHQQQNCYNCGSSGVQQMGGGAGYRCSRCGAGTDFRGPRGLGPMYTSVQHQATVQTLNVATPDGRILINSGDEIRMPTGQTVKVNQVRRHETARGHYYLDTDAGPTVLKYDAPLQVVRNNQQQQAFPGASGNNYTSNELPFGGQRDQGTDTQQYESGGDAVCQNCGAKGSLQRQGDKFVCSRCGYPSNYSGGGDIPFGGASQTIRTTTSRDHRSAVARRAAAVLDQMKENTL